MTRLKDIPIKDRLLSKIDIQSNGCWIWKGSIQGDGRYGTFKFNGKYSNPQRASYTIFKKEIPEGYVIINCCGSTLCLNPDHLESVTKEQQLNRVKSYHKIMRHSKSSNNEFNWKKINKELQNTN